jgi:methylaspartate mutase sigma subunit
MQKTVVIGTIGSDCHVIGSWVLSRALGEAGFKTVFLGAVVPQEEFISAAIETSADAILVSSMYGMGVLDCEGLRSKCIEAGLGKILLYAGGMLTVQMEVDRGWTAVEERFGQMGFDRVFPPKTKPDAVIESLRKDLGIGQEPTHPAERE